MLLSDDTSGMWRWYHMEVVEMLEVDLLNVRMRDVGRRRLVLMGGQGGVESRGLELGQASSQHCKKRSDGGKGAAKCNSLKEPL